ncbi:MAG: copper oxidase [Steroidobacteraceae bacterium]|nr:copper oxidase [Nevskiaceae bacterium]MCP5340397.1 copper oxidase [Nevskiaceae bacterium]MCP5360237.1 copper oxidase [Nevskiaceae bacterium]MCP5466626.1 copper oxidase [Nevskiaceae bacterium]
MKYSRRKLVLGAGATTVAGFAATQAAAGTGSNTGAAATPSTTGATRSSGYRPVRTLNGWSLPYRLRGGVKEFHLVAEEIEHEFGPGSKAKCWGYNGTTPGPTIEAVEGDRVRIYVTNRLREHTSVHWHGILLPSGMDGVGGLNQPHIQPGETFVYEFTLRQHGTHMYHPHADEMTQLAFGMMGLFIIHPRAPDTPRVDRDYAILLHNWALHPGTYRPDPSIMTDFDLWTFNSKVFPAIDPIVAATGERVRIRIGNLSMWNHPIHIHGPRFWITGGDGGRQSRANWRSEVTEIVGVGQTRDLEFDAIAGDWAMHCHMSHHTMNAMGHELPNPVGVDQSDVASKLSTILPGYMAMGEHGMGDHQTHVDMGHMPGPENTLPMMMGKGPYGNVEMGGMFTVIKVRDGLRPGDYGDPGWYRAPAGTVARKVSSDPDFGSPVRRGPLG